MASVTWDVLVVVRTWSKVLDNGKSQTGCFTSTHAIHPSQKKNHVWAFRVRFACEESCDPATAKDDNECVMLSMEDKASWIPVNQRVKEWKGERVNILTRERTSKRENEHQQRVNCDVIAKKKESFWQMWHGWIKISALVSFWRFITIMVQDRFRCISNLLLVNDYHRSNRFCLNRLQCVAYHYSSGSPIIGYRNNSADLMGGVKSPLCVSGKFGRTSNISFWVSIPIHSQMPFHTTSQDVLGMKRPRPILHWPESVRSCGYFPNIFPPRTWPPRTM